MTPAELCAALVRTTLASSAAACLAAVLLGWLRVESPRIHRAAWALVVLQGWLLLPLTVEIQSPPTPSALRYEYAGNAAIADALTPSRQPTKLAESPATPAEPAARRMHPLAMWAWMAGAALLPLAAAGRYVRLIRTLPLGAALDNPQWQQEWRRQRDSMGVRRRVDFRLTDRLGPLVAYIPFAYLILAPRSAWTSLSPSERIAILRHELAHIRRRDLWKSLALRALALPQWFNPLVWLAVRRFDEAAEWACDAAACCTARDRPAVAGALLHTAELTASHATPRAAGMISAVPSANQRRRSSAFSRRIRRLVAPSLKKESTMKQLIVPALLVIVAAGQLVRVERVVAKPAEERLSLANDEATAGPYAATSPAKRREYVESIWPRYIIEPPDILSIEGVKLVPKAPHQLEPFDVVLVRVQGARPEQPIDDTYSIDADGSINLGPTYGRIKVAGDTIEKAESRLREELAQKLGDVSVSASLVASAGAQQISGQHLVAPDGRVNLGVYGSVFVAGMTLEEARAAIEKKLSAQLEQPQVAVDVLAYNSKVYYVIYKGAKLGDNVTRMPITGNETVLDAVASMGGLSSIASNTMWLARPAPNGIGPEQILPVAWDDIARGESSATNYQLMPGDRLFIETQEPTEKEKKRPDSGTSNSSSKRDSKNADQSPSPYHLSDDVQYYPSGPRGGPAEYAIADAAHAGKEKIEFHFHVFTDPDGNLSELEDFSVVETHTARATFRVFEKQKLVSHSINPHVLTELGRPASIELSDESVVDSRMDISRLAINATVTKTQEPSRSRSGDNEYILSVDVKQGRFSGNVQTVFERIGLKTAVIRFNPPLGERKSLNETTPAIYILVTPIWK